MVEFFCVHARWYASELLQFVFVGSSDGMGMRQRRGDQRKNGNDLPYERAKRLFVFQYWKVSPLYSLFEHALAWQEKDLDETRRLEDQGRTKHIIKHK